MKIDDEKVERCIYDIDNEIQILLEQKYQLEEIRNNKELTQENIYFIKNFEDNLEAQE